MPASEAPGSWRQEGHRAAKPAPDSRAGERGELWTKEFSSWPQTKQLLLVTVSSRPWPPPPYPAGSSHLQQILPGFMDVMNTSAQAVCVLPGACFSHFLPQEGSPVSRRPAPVTSLPKKPLETGAFYTCLRIFMLMEHNNSRIAVETFADWSCPGSHDLERTPHHQSFWRPPRPAEVGDPSFVSPQLRPCVCSQAVNARQ